MKYPLCRYILDVLPDTTIFQSLHISKTFVSDILCYNYRNWMTRWDEVWMDRRECWNSYVDCWTEVFEVEMWKKEKTSFCFWSMNFDFVTQCAGAIFNLYQSSEAKTAFSSYYDVKQVWMRQKIHLLKGFPPK